MSLCTVCTKVVCNHTPDERGQTEAEVRRALTMEEKIAVDEFAVGSSERLALARRNAHIPATPQARTAYGFLKPYYL